MNEVNRKNDEQIFAQGKQGFRKIVKFVWATYSFHSQNTKFSSIFQQPTVCRNW